MKGTIDKLFGSKTRVKLLQLFLSNPGKPYYVREITRLIDEQINSVRRELANMLGVGVIVSESSDNKLYYQVNQRYEYYVALRAIFAGTEVEALSSETINQAPAWHDELRQLTGAKVVLLAGVLVDGSKTKVDVLVAGKVNKTQFKKLMASVESFEGRELNYTTMTYDDFYYRLKVRDRFVSEVLQNDHIVLLDSNHIITSREG